MAVLNEILGLHNRPKAAVHSAHKLTGPEKKKKKKTPQHRQTQTFVQNMYSFIAAQQHVLGHLQDHH